MTLRLTKICANSHLYRTTFMSPINSDLFLIIYEANTDMYRANICGFVCNEALQFLLVLLRFVN